MYVDYRWFLERQEEILRDDLTVNDFSVLVGLAQCHGVDPPRHELWRELIYDIRGLRLDSYGIAERLRSWRRA